MNLDELQQAWQSQDAGRQVRIDAGLLLKAVRRNQRSFKATIFWRDFREIIAAGFVIFVSIVVARLAGWHWLSLAAASVWVVGFLLVDRWRQKNRGTLTQEPLVSCLDASLEDVIHQIWLLHNVAWWYLLPLLAACLIALAYTTWAIPEPFPTWVRAVVFLLGSGIVLAVDYGVYRLNQSAVRNCLEPRRDELLAIRDSLVTPDDGPAVSS